MEIRKSLRPVSGSHVPTLLLSILLILQAVSTKALWGMIWPQFPWTKGNEDKLDPMHFWDPDWDKRDPGEGGTPFEIDSLEILSSRLQTKPSKLHGPKETCWQSAYSKMGIPCREILDFGVLQSKLGLMLTDCFLGISGRGGIEVPVCRPVERLKGERVTDCLQSLDDHTLKIFLTFFMDIVSECQSLEGEGFKQDTEKAISDLYESARTSNTILKVINREMDSQRGKLFKLTDQIMAGQKDLLDSQVRLKASIDEGLTRATARTKSIAEGLKDLHRSQAKMHGEYEEVTQTLVSDLQGLRRDMDEINRVVDVLQGAVQVATKEIKDEQEEVMGGFRELWGLMQESRLWSEAYVRKVNETFQVEHEAMLTYKTAVDELHQRLLGEFDQMEANNKWISEQQKEMNSKLKTVLNGFTAMNEGWWMNSHVLKSIFMYLLIYGAIYITTIPRQTQNARLLLSVGFLVSFLSEMYLIYYDSWRLELDKENGELQHVKMSPSWLLVRYTFYVLGGGFLVYSYFSFRDYNVLNNKMLQEVRGKQYKADRDLVIMSKNLKAVRNRMASVNTSNRQMVAEILELRKSLAEASSHALLRRDPWSGHRRQHHHVAQRGPHEMTVSRFVSSEPARSNVTAPF